MEIVTDKAFLTKPCEPVQFPISIKTVDEMVKLMRKSGGVGLAANQVGIPLRFFVATYGGQTYKIFNPEIIKRSRKRVYFKEGCLSIPGKESDTHRYWKLKIRHQDKFGRERTRKVFGMLAIIFQHEIDHLNGKLI